MKKNEDTYFKQSEEWKASFREGSHQRSLMKSRIILYYMLFALYIIVAIKGIWVTSYQNSAVIFGIDFSIFWIASSFTLAGMPEMVYNSLLHHQGIEAIFHRYIPYVLAYFYPPYTLFFFLPLALMPFFIAYGVWHILGLALYGIFMWKVFRDKIVLAMAFSFPGVLFNLFWGQNAVYITILLLGFIYYMDRKPIMAGIFLGILCFKPQLALFCFIAMLAARNWQCLAVAVTIPITLSLASIIIWGTQIWSNYFALTKSFAEVSLLSGWVETAAVQPTIYSFLRLLGLSCNVALVIQYVIFVIMGIIVYYVWRRRIEGDLLATQILIFCILIGLPYYIQYDMFIAIIPVSIYWIRRTVRFDNTNMFIMHFLWAMPVLCYIIVRIIAVQIAPIGFAVGLVFSLHEFLRKSSRVNIFSKDIK